MLAKSYKMSIRSCSFQLVLKKRLRIVVVGEDDA